MSIPVSFSLELERSGTQPLFVQICDQLRRHIMEGEIVSHHALPASRNLATELGVSRSTVVTAYEQLVAEGYIAGKRGSGYYVRPLTGSDTPRQRTVKAAAELPVSDQPAISPVRHPGYPDNRLFPFRAWARNLARSARLAPHAMVISDSPFGDPDLRRAIADYLAEWRGLEVHPRQVMVTAGSVDALETCMRTLTRPGDVIGLENPCYRPLRNLSLNQGLQIESLEVGRNGAALPQTEKRGSTTHLVVVTPSHQFPLGGAMPVNRRREFLQWAAAKDAWIIEDDYDSEFRYAGRPIPALASLDDTGRSIYVGTFSKVFSVSLRLGYLIMPEALIGDFENTLSRFGVKAALPCQRALADFIDNGDFYRHIRRVRRIYAERRRLLLELVQQHLSPYGSVQDHQAGMLMAFRLMKGFDDRSIVSRAQQQGVQVAPLSSYYNGRNVEQGLLLGFCPFDEAEIRNNIEKLVTIIEGQAQRDGLSPRENDPARYA